MHIEFLVEELSLQETLDILLLKILPESITFKIHAFRGKEDMLSKLPSRLKGYKQWIPDDWKLVTIVDEDRQDCKVLKETLEKMAIESGFITKSSAKGEQSFQIINRIVVEELEAWFFGDVNALVSAYPKVSKTITQKTQYRDPDAIKGGTWEALERVLQKAGYHLGGLEKVKAARDIAPYMNPQDNCSKSFQVFYAALLATIA